MKSHRAGDKKEQRTSSFSKTIKTICKHHSCNLTTLQLVFTGYSTLVARQKAPSTPCTSRLYRHTIPRTHLPVQESLQHISGSACLKFQVSSFQTVSCVPQYAKRTCTHGHHRIYLGLQTSKSLGDKCIVFSWA